MCTVSAVHSPDYASLRVVINRDERRLRMAARPPARVEKHGTQAVWPVDQEAGGTWVAASEHGLAFVLINVTPSAPGSRRADTGISRGAVIPSLIGGVDISDVERRFAAGPARWPCSPFKLLVASLDRILVLSRDGAADVSAPYILSSSSLGDARVEQPRRQLFEHLLATSDHAWRAQDRLHQHAWPDRRDISVMMSRADACTVSRTEILLTHGATEMKYVTIRDGWPAGVASPPLTLAHRRAVAAA